MFNQLKKIFNPHKEGLHPQKGQSMAELAIALPVLLILFLGVFETGWAIRSYVVMTNANRESARFAVKSSVLDFSVKDPATVGYNTVLTQTEFSIADQLALDFFGADANSTIIMSHLVIDTGFPCVEYQGNSPKVPYEFDTNCNCATGDPSDPDGDGTPWFGRDDLIALPGDPNFPHYSATFGITGTTTRLGNGSLDAEAARLIESSNQLNCNMLKTGAPASALPKNNMFAAEIFYDQPQILGAPIISNRLTDPIPLYGHTVMRIVPSRDDISGSDIGPTCELYPMTFPEDIFSGYDPHNPPAGGIPVDAFQGTDPGNFGWLTWNPASGNNNANYIAEELDNPRLSMYDFINASDPSDTSLSLGDDVSSGPGVMNSNDVDDLLESLAGQTIRVPIFSSSTGSGANTKYTISHFALIRVDDICLPRNSCPGVSGNDKQIKATFIGYDDEACIDASGPVGGPASTPTPTPTSTTSGPVDTPTATPTATDASTSTPTPTNTPTETSVPTDTPTPTPTVATLSLNINSTEVTVQKDGSWYIGKASVFIKDSNGNNIQNATVQGYWTGAVPTGDCCDNTNSSGKAVIWSDWGKNKRGQTFTFCVTSVTKSGYTSYTGSPVCVSGVKN